KPQSTRRAAAIVTVAVSLFAGVLQLPTPSAQTPRTSPIKPAPPPQACFHFPFNQLCSTIPHDVIETLSNGYSQLGAAQQRPFDNFAWQLFVALNWPANPDGSASKEPITKDPTARKPRVWEFYNTVSDLFSAGLSTENIAPTEIRQEARQTTPARLFTMLS